MQLFTYIAMLRGINVGRTARIKMTGLVSVFESIGFKNVRTYVQSGNVICRYSGNDIANLIKTIEVKLKSAFHQDINIIVRTATDMQRVIAHNPFLQEPDLDTEILYVTFLSGTPVESGLAQFKQLQVGPDRFIIIDREIYLYCPNGYGKTRLSNDFFERKLHVTATTRNWKTVTALFDIAQNTIE
jgi:uncharacterized protein (DUF1697 family)